MAILKQDLQKMMRAATDLELLLKPIETAAQYDQAVEWLNCLLDEVNGAKEHPLLALINTLGDHIGDYDDQHYVLGAEPDPIGMLKSLMEQHGLKQKDLVEIFGGTGVTSEVLNGKRKLNARHIDLLAKRFAVSPGVFF